MEHLQTACKTIQFKRPRRVVSPTASDLTFDFTLSQESICSSCDHRGDCQLAGLLNVPVKRCKYYERPALMAN